MSRHAGNCPGHVPGKEWSGEHYMYFLTIKMKSKFFKFKILQRIIRKFPAIQWNRPNVILFHETIPLKYVFFYVRLEQLKELNQSGRREIFSAISNLQTISALTVLYSIHVKSMHILSMSCPEMQLLVWKLRAVLSHKFWFLNVTELQDFGAKVKQMNWTYKTRKQGSVK
jgi:hypothetical protein